MLGRGCPTHGGAAASEPRVDNHNHNHNDGDRTGDRRGAGIAPVWTQPVGACIGRGGFASVWEIPDGVLKVAHWPFVGAIATSFRSRWVTGRILRSTFADPSRVTEADVDQYYAPVPDPAYGRALRGVLREFRFDSLGGRLDRVQAPTLILWGDMDRWIPLRDGSRFARELQRSELALLSHSGHDAPEESPDQVNRYLLAYLKEGLSRIPENVAVVAASEHRH